MGHWRGKEPQTSACTFLVVHSLRGKPGSLGMRFIGTNAGHCLQEPLWGGSSLMGRVPGFASSRTFSYL